MFYKDATSAQRSAVTAATAGSDAGAGSVAYFSDGESAESSNQDDESDGKSASRMSSVAYFSDGKLAESSNQDDESDSKFKARMKSRMGWMIWYDW